MNAMSLDTPVASIVTLLDTSEGSLWLAIMIAADLTQYAAMGAKYRRLGT